ncbi:hypothetical protein YH65_04755 [Sulfurovum lithotrophicum]|uniref:YbbD head domain-containing protein n=1 Tax=Sulfurovum lithotrophicum TaxID=206403 RepID=A0A7U4RQK3_9BACT|nr:hypothetical protein [Sulfurovum lithotrophicum]AKF24771.1 hypothetical protein YH65_04755 [Sulfurovum lithotrophicum]
MKKIIIAMLLFFVAVFFMLKYYFSDTLINKYSDTASVKEDKAIKNGWVPALLPDSAYDIEETHDMDTNQLFGRFYYKERDEAVIVQKLAPVPDMNQTYEWGNFLFRINKEKNEVRYRNKP